MFIFIKYGGQKGRPNDHGEMKTCSVTMQWRNYTKRDNFGGHKPKPILNIDFFLYLMFFSYGYNESEDIFSNIVTQY